MSDKHKKLPHDALFKRIMENDIAAKEFLNGKRQFPCTL